MSQTISPEQRSAIESGAGVVLSAGAGAGKTFVIIEHLIETLRKFEGANSAVDVDEYLSSIVVITFTKKAARELKKRVELKLKELSSQSDYWSNVYESRSNCFIGTIHSYCFSLLKTVKSIEFSSYELAEDGMIRQKIKTETLAYLEKKPSILESYNFKDLEHSLEKIFFNSKLRNEWEDEIAHFDGEALTKQFFDLYQVNAEISFPQDKKLKWIDFIQDFQREYSKPNPSQRMTGLIDLFNNLKRLPTPPKKSVSEDITNSFSEIKELKGAITDFSQALDDFDESLVEKSKKLQNLFEYVSKNYFNDSRISFSDIEYLMLRHGGEIDFHISKLIVDEFQDVSDVQFEIFKKLIKEDYSRIFAVGDKKQAIYGFRGGEVSVFEMLASKVQENLSMIDNYRSSEGIVKFNNSLFAKEFPDEDKQQAKSDDLGEIEIIEAKPINVSEPDLKEVESTALIQLLKNKIEGGSKEIAILYRFLAPAKKLIKNLMASDIGFECSLKVEKSEEPMQAILVNLLSTAAGKQTSDNCYYFIKGYLDYLELPSEKLSEQIKDFLSSLEFLNTSLAWTRFLSGMGINYGHAESTFSQLKQYERLFHGSISKILYAFNDSLKDRVVINVSNHFRDSQIHIMTAHSSKGLEFDEVIVANIMSNSRGRSDKVLLGDTPLSFSYMVEGKRRLTPSFQLERKEESLKKESESMRLFYVACTRAVNKLSFIISPELAAKMSSACWGTYLNRSLDELKNATFIPLDVIPSNILDLKSSFHSLNFQVTSTDKPRLIGVMPEASVAKLSLLKKCPRKFYYKNIIGFSDDDFPRLKSEEAKKPLKSSAQRGSLIHQEISDHFLEGKELSNEFIFLKKLLNQYDQSYEFYSEKEMKFQVDGQMISGTPDLVVIKDEEIEIWDFKTGAQNDEKDETYQVQIALYLYGWIQITNKSYKKISSKIIYLDEEKTVEDKFDGVEELNNEVNTLIKSLYTYQRKIGRQCESCIYQKICLTETLLSEIHHS